MSATKHGFKTEVQQLLDILIHSLYSDREIFLRELISNAADALDKYRFQALTDSTLVASLDAKEEIRISVDEEAHTITIEDDGIGMTRDEVVKNLGTIAHSGSKDFTKRLAEASSSDAPDLIGQFGVGFYSAFMVADEVVVETRSAQADAQAIRWSSTGAGTYVVEDIEREHRGTTLTLKLREGAQEFADTTMLSSIVRKHSNFITWPVVIGEEQANSGKALWMQSPSEIDDEEANAFYKTVATDWQDPTLRIHVSADMPVQYHALVFVPQGRPFDLFHPNAESGPRLYARRVLITEHAKDVLPNWLRFVRGVVDSEDISLNVSREMVQKTPVVQKIRKHLVKRILGDLKKLSLQEADEGTEGPSPREQYEAIWKNFGSLLKEGYYHDRHTFGKLLLPLLRFESLKGGESKLISLAEYKESMQEDQDTIWFLTAASREEALSSPHLEAFRRKDLDVLLLTEPVDEWLMQSLTEFDELPLKSVSRGDLDLDDEEEGDKADLTGLLPYLKETLTGAVVDVRESSRLTDSPCVLVDDEHGMSSNMERILRAANQPVTGVRRILEVNPKHSILRNMAVMQEAGKEAELAPLAQLLYDNAVLLDGSVTEPGAIGRRLQALLQKVTDQGAETQG